MLNFLPKNCHHPGGMTPTIFQKISFDLIVVVEAMCFSCGKKVRVTMEKKEPEKVDFKQA